MVRMSSAKANTVSYWCDVDEPMPGRSIPISRICRFSA
jgi:hypothetical protein